MAEPALRRLFSAFLPTFFTGIFLAIAGPANAKFPVAVLGTWVEAQDSLYCESLAKDLGQALADDTALLVYDLRGRHKRRLDSAQAAKGLEQSPDLLSAVSGGQVKWGLAVDCRSERREDERGDYLCRLGVLAMRDGRRTSLDSLRFLPEAAEKRRQLGQSLARAFAGHFLSKPSDAPARGGLRISPPANPAILVRDMQVIRRGPIAEVPFGATLVIGDAPGLMVIATENAQYILYPNSSYTYVLPMLVQLNSGSLGILGGVDSSTLTGRLRSATALDSSNLVWRNLARLAALDSNNLLWRGLGKVSSPDSGNPLARTLGQAAALDSSNPLYRALRQVAALDTSNLVWRGLGKVSSLDSSNFLWQKLGGMALDSNSLWRKLGLLAFQESTLVLTPSMAVRGLPQAVLIRQEGSATALEVVRGTMAAHPLLGSQPPEPVGPLRAVHSRGFALKQERMTSLRGDRILRELEGANPARGNRSLATFLPGKLFAAGASLRTPDRPIQSFISGEFREMDMEVDVLSPEREGWSETGAFRSGAQESGCYLCSPDRIGP